MQDSPEPASAQSAPPHHGVASEALLCSVMEQTPEALVICDELGRIVRLSAPAEALCGRDALLRPFDDVFEIEFPEDDSDVANFRRFDPKSVVGAALAGGVARAVRAVARCADGLRLDVLFNAYAIHAEEGRVVGCVVSLTDVSAVRRAEASLRETEQRFRSVLENSLDAVYRLNLQTGRFDYLSPSVQSTHGFTVEELAAFRAEELESHIHPEDRPTVSAAIKASEVTGELVVEYRFKNKDGQYRWLAERATLIREEGGHPAFRCGVIRDTTERRRVEQALRAANLELAEADRLKNEFLAVLSHELRNPLTPIRNSTYVLERAAPGSDQARRALAVIQRQTDQLGRLVDDLLDVTRISSNKIQLQRQRIELNELARRVLEKQHPLFESGEIQLDFQPASDPVWVNADWNRFAQILDNLLRNAVELTKPGGVTHVTISTDRAQKRAVICVADTGMGMTREMIDRLFDPFVATRASLPDGKGGLDLGLALARGLVELHGGTITAESAGIGTGSEFIVQLPLASEESIASQAGRAKSAGQRRRVLIIEDNVDAANSLREALGFGDHEIAVAYDGATGLAKAREFGPDVVLCDIGLPGMSGYDVARALRADDALRGTHLVALSGYALPEDLQRAEDAGFERHLAKPISPEAIEALLRSVEHGGNAD